MSTKGPERCLIIRRYLLVAVMFAVSWAAFAQAENVSLRVGVFDVDATPPLGTPIAYARAKEVMDPLSCRGVVLLGDGLPIVLCAVDWLSLRNGAHDAFRIGLAEAAQTSPDRVAVHVLHQHDAPSYDFDAETLLNAHGEGFPADHCRETIRRAGDALEDAISNSQPVTHLSYGRGKVENVASNRRVLGPDGKVVFSRWSSMRDAKASAAPEGVIDPHVRLVSLWNDEQPLVAISWYATHPQSYYTRGSISSDFVGMARKMREVDSGVFHLHFNGAGGNITAGKYNNGEPANRILLAERLAQGMNTAWQEVKKVPLAASEVGWRVEPVALPPSPDLDEEALIEKLNQDPKSGGASDLAWIRRCNRGHQIRLACLELGPVRVLHMPGELFIEYQLSAQAMRPDLFVCMAAYGDGGPGYIGTRDAYPQGGYETGGPSNVAPEVEEVLTAAMRRLLNAEDRTDIAPSDWTNRDRAILR